MLDEKIDEIVSDGHGRGLLGPIRSILLTESLNGNRTKGLVPLVIQDLIKRASEGERLTSKYKYVREYNA